MGFLSVKRREIAEGEKQIKKGREKVWLCLEEEKERGRALLGAIRELLVFLFFSWFFLVVVHFGFIGCTSIVSHF